MIAAHSATEAWIHALRMLVETGDPASPRGRPTTELLQRTFCIDTRNPVVLVKRRRLNYRFMAAEAHWILSGDNRVDTIKPYNSRIAEFSDDGEVFFGAYGPKIQAQLDYVVQKLFEDPSSREAGLTIWRENPPATKDVPCTIGLFWSIRDGRLNCHAFMRSSDVWLGLPYDLFNFSMLTHVIAGYLSPKLMVEPGVLWLTAASSHLYERNRREALACLTDDEAYNDEPVPAALSASPRRLMVMLAKIKDTVKPFDHWCWHEFMGTSA